jgi:hypothetical protein
VDKVLFISKGVVKLLNTTLSMPVGDNPYYGFLANTRPTFVPTSVLHVLIKSVQISAINQSEDELAATIDPLMHTYQNVEKVSSKQIGICKIETVCIYFEKLKTKKGIVSSVLPTLDAYTAALTKAKVEKCITSLQFRTNKNTTRGLIDIKLSAPQVRAYPSVIRDLLNVFYDWINAKKDLHSDTLQFSSIKNTEIEASKPTKSGIKRKIHISCKAHVEQGDCSLYYSLDASNDSLFNILASRQKRKTLKIAAQYPLPAISIEIIHMSPVINKSTSNSANTHFNTTIHWEGAQLTPHSVYFFLELSFAYSIWTRTYKKTGMKRRCKDDKKDLEYEPNISKPLTWMKYVRAVIHIQRMYRGHLARKFVKELRERIKKGESKLSKRLEHTKTKNEVSRHTDTFSFLCHILPFKIELICGAVTNVTLRLEFTKSFNLLFSRSFRSVKTHNSKGSAIYNTVFVSLPEVNVRCLQMLSSQEFASLHILGVKGNLGSGYGTFLRPDMESVRCATANIQNVNLNYDLTQLNVFLIIYTLWMDKYDEANKLITKKKEKYGLEGKLASNSNQRKDEIASPSLSSKRRGKPTKIATEEVVFEPTPSNFAQVMLSRIEIHGDLGAAIGKQDVSIGSSILSIFDLGRYENNAMREPLQINGCIGTLSVALRERLEGMLTFEGAILTLTRHFRIGGTDVTIRGRTELNINILPISIDMDYNKNKILYINLKKLVGKFRDVFNGSKDGENYHVQTVFTSEGIAVSISKMTATSFIKLFHRLQEQITRQNQLALEILQSHSEYYRSQSDLLYPEKLSEIKSLDIRNPMEQLTNTIAVGSITIMGKDLFISLYDRDYNPSKDDEWLQFSMKNYRIELARAPKDLGASQYQIQRKVSILLSRVDVNRVLGDKAAYILQVPRGASIQMKSVQEVKSKMIQYIFDSSFADAINVTTNLTLYQSLRNIISKYKKEIDQEFQSQSSLLNTKTIITPRTTTLNTNTNKGSSSNTGKEGFVFEGKIDLNPKLNVLGDMTPKVETVLTWLGIKDKNVIPRATHSGVVSPLEIIFVTSFDISEHIETFVDAWHMDKSL